MSNTKENEDESRQQVPGTLETEQLIDAQEVPVEQVDNASRPSNPDTMEAGVLQKSHQDSTPLAPIDYEKSLPKPELESAKDVKADVVTNLRTCAGNGIAISSSHLGTVKFTGDVEIIRSDISHDGSGHDTGAVPEESHEIAGPQAGSSDVKPEVGNERKLDDVKNKIDVATSKSNGDSKPRRSFLLDENSSGSESGTEEEQNEFVGELYSFFREKGLEFKPPKFYGDFLNCLKLWRSVMKLGGYDQVTSNKLWRQVGDSFNPPKTCTTVSWTFRGFYEKVLLDYERHVTNASDVNIPIAPKSAPKLPKSPKSEPIRVDNKASGSGRARRDAAARAMQGWHSLRFLGNGEVSSPIIKEKREKEIKNIGSLKRKKPSYVEHAVKSPRTKGTQLDVEVIDMGAPADWVKINVQKTKDSFEVYALVPGLLREEVRVQSDPAGRLVISGEPEHEDNPWGVAPFKKVVSLPSRIDPHQTTAVVTLHGQLYVRVPFEQSD